MYIKRDQLLNKKTLITMDRDPLSKLENGYQMMHLFDFLLNDQALETD